jgi:hypothetical protein
MHPDHAPLRGQGVFFRTQSSEDCIINMPGFDLRQAQAIEARSDITIP